MEYEINYLILQSNTAELTKLRQEMEDLIKSCGCEVLEKKEYLKRKLAYEINREGYGFHTVLRFKFPEGKVDIQGLKNKMNLNFKVARYLIIRPDGLGSLKELEKKAEVKNKEESSEKNTVVKQEEVEKILAEEKKKGVKSMVKPKIKSDIEPKVKEGEIKKEDIEKIKETEDKKGQQEKELKDREAESKEKESKKEERKSTKDKEKVSLDDLDEKLDEILNI